MKNSNVIRELLLLTRLLIRVKWIIREKKRSRSKKDRGQIYPKQNLFESITENLCNKIQSSTKIKVSSIEIKN